MAFSQSVLNSVQLIVSEPASGVGGASLKVTGGTMTLKNSQNVLGQGGLTGGVSGVSIGVSGISTTLNANYASDEYLVTQKAVYTYVNAIFSSLTTYVDTTLAGKVDKLNIIGLIAPFATSTVPTDWLECNGAAVSRTTYAVLFASIGTSFGVGDGSTTFNLPDLQGRAPIGSGTGASLTARTVGQQLGTETHTLTVNEMPAHTHDFRTYNANFDHQGSATEGSTKDDGDGSFIDASAVQSAGGGQAHNNMQPSLVVKYYIRALP